MAAFNEGCSLLTVAARYTTLVLSLEMLLLVRIGAYVVGMAEMAMEETLWSLGVQEDFAIHTVYVLSTSTLQGFTEQNNTSTLVWRHC